MQQPRLFQLIRFLRKELSIPKDAIALAIARWRDAIPHLPIVLWEYGLVTIEQLDQIFDWVEASSTVKKNQTCSTDHCFNDLTHATL